MIWLKGCPKCSGDMHYDPLVEEYVCLQCGLSVDRPPPGEEESPLRALRPAQDKPQLRPLAAAAAPGPEGQQPTLEEERHTVPEPEPARTGPAAPGVSAAQTGRAGRPALRVIPQTSGRRPEDC